MLTGIRFNPQNDSACIRPDDRYSRNLKEDIKAAMELLFQFKEGLEKLHPECAALIELLLQNPNRVNNRY